MARRTRQLLEPIEAWTAEHERAAEIVGGLGLVVLGVGLVVVALTHTIPWRLALPIALLVGAITSPFLARSRAKQRR